MTIKRALIETLPDSAKRLLAIPYDWYQVRNADRIFSRKELPDVSVDPDAPEHIILLVVDALRADRMSPRTAPFLNDIDGFDAITPGTWTFPAVTSMMTGRYPHEHGSILGQASGSSDRLVLPPALSQSELTLGEVLAGAGYDTYGGFGHDTPFIALSGRFETHALSHQIDSSARDVLSEHLSWLRSRSNDRTFSYIHLADPHIPVDPPPSYWDEFEVDATIPNIKTWAYRCEERSDDVAQKYRSHRRKLYDASVKYVDDSVRWYTEQLMELNGESVTIVTSDHGELFWDQLEVENRYFDGSGCVGHGGTPYEALTRVPIRVLGTDVEMSSQATPSLVDLPNTILEMAGVHNPLSTSGVSWFDEVPNGRIIVSEGNLTENESKALYKDRWKLIIQNAETCVGFQLPEETECELPAEIDQELQRRVEGMWSTADDRTEVSNLVESRLNKLGYK